MSFWLKLFFQLLYHQLAWTYDLVARIVSLGSWQEWVLCALPYLPGRDILELGHGPGHMQVELLTAGKRSFALDLSWQMNRMAFHLLKRNHLPGNIINGYAQSLPFPDASFNHIVATFPTEYIFQPETLSEARRVLRDSGTLVVIPAAILTGKGWIVRALRLIYKVTGQGPDAFDQQFIDHLVQPFHSAGFDTTAKVNDLGNSQVMVLITSPRRAAPEKTSAHAAISTSIQPS